MNILERGQSCAEIGIKAEEKAQILQMKTKKGAVQVLQTMRHALCK